MEAGKDQLLLLLADADYVVDLSHIVLGMVTILQTPLQRVDLGWNV
jgi:hypothetical protein